MASIIFCQAGASLPSDPSGSCGPCLVFMITLEGLVANVGGIRFYQAPWWAPNVLVDSLRSVSKVSSALTYLHAMLRDADL